MHKLLSTTCRSLRVDELLEHLVRLSQVGDTASDELIQPADDRLGRASPDGDDGAVGADGGLLVVLVVGNRGIGGRGDVDEGSSLNTQSEALEPRTERPSQATPVLWKSPRTDNPLLQTVSV